MGGQLSPQKKQGETENDFFLEGKKISERKRKKALAK